MHPHAHQDCSHSHRQALREECFTREALPERARELLIANGLAVRPEEELEEDAGGVPLTEAQREEARRIAEGRPELRD